MADQDRNRALPLLTVSRATPDSDTDSFDTGSDDVISRSSDETYNPSEESGDRAFIARDSDETDAATDEDEQRNARDNWLVSVHPGRGEGTEANRPQIKHDAVPVAHTVLQTRALKVDGQPALRQYLVQGTW